MTNRSTWANLLVFWKAVGNFGDVANIQTDGHIKTQ